MRLVLTCEHGGHAVPATYRPLFVGAEAVLSSHRGWDPGSLPLARWLARNLGAPLQASTVSRLVVDLNRSETHPAVFSDFTRTLPGLERERLLQRHHRPHRQDVLERIAAEAAPVLHVAVHSFVPVLDERPRDFDVGLLYDPGRSLERRLAAAWCQRLRALQWPTRRNAPYRGVSDGLTTWLRTRFVDSRYAGIELEVNQRVLEQNGPRRRLYRDLLACLGEMLVESEPASCR